MKKLLTFVAMIALLLVWSTEDLSAQTYRRVESGSGTLAFKVADLAAGGGKLDSLAAIEVNVGRNIPYLASNNCIVSGVIADTTGSGTPFGDINVVMDIYEGVVSSGAGINNVTYTAVTAGSDTMNLIGSAVRYAVTLKPGTRYKFQFRTTPTDTANTHYTGSGTFRYIIDMIKQ